MNLKQNIFLCSVVILTTIIFHSVQSNPLSDLLKSKGTKVDSPLKLKNILKNGLESVPVKDLCLACEVALPIAKYFFKNNKTEDIKLLVDVVCQSFKIEDAQVCNDVLDMYTIPVVTVAVTTSLTEKQLCSAVLNCGEEESPLLNWNITLPSTPKPPVVPPVPPKAGSPTLRILHLSDIHIDFEYQPGSVANCNEPICCRSTSNPIPNVPKVPAGYWGDYNHCDIPLYTVESMFDHINKTEKFDFVYWTGDLPPHFVWHQTRNESIEALKMLTKLFLKYFPNKIVYPSVGNHEGIPCNLYPTPLIESDNTSWLYTELAKDWTQTGLPQDLADNITTGAFYYLDIQPGLRLISLNMNFCPTLNFWLFVNSTDPLDQLKWLADILQECENNGLKAHIIGHINPSGCMSSWSHNYYRIVNRYESTIVGQFFGHTHNDEFEIFYDLDDVTRPVGVAYLAGGVTTEPTLNPGYRIYTVDGGYSGASFYVMDIDNFFVNLTEANLSNMPKVQKEYSAKEEYEMDTMYARDWNELVNRLIKNPSDPMADKIYQHFYKSWDGRSVCDSQCKANFLCHFKQARPEYIIPC